MEQFFILIAVVIFLMFRRASASARRGGSGENPFDELMKGTTSPSDAVEGPDARRTAASLRALEALQRWETRQTAATASEETGRETRPSPTRREPMPAPPRDRSRRVTLARTAAERDRRRQYSDIATILEAERRHRFRARPSIERPPAEALPAAPPPVPVERDRPESARETEGPAQARSESQADRSQRTGDGQGALGRLEHLPLAARAIVYGEILGPPKAQG